MQPVTDPAILAQLNGTGPQPVTDPAILAQLNGSSAPHPDAFAGSEANLTPGQLSGLAHGAWRGLTDPVEGLHQLGAHIHGWWSGDKSIGEKEDAGVNKRETEYQAAQRERGVPEGGDFARVAGNVASPVNVVAGGRAAAVADMVPTALGRTLTRGTLTGGAMAASEPVHNSEDYLGTKSEQLQTGAILGGVTEPVAATLGRMVQGVQNPQKRILLDENVPLTVGQMLANDHGKGMYKATEDKLESVPIFGDMIKARREESGTGLNRAALNRVLEPFGETLPHDIPMGREALDHVSRRASQGFDDALVNMHGQMDSTLQRDLVGIRGNAAVTLPHEQQNALARLHDTISDIFASHGGPGQWHGVLPGDALKGLDTHLGEEARSLAADPSHFNRRLGDHVEYTRDAYRDMINRVNQGHQTDALANANRAWAQWVRVRDAAASGGNNNGIFSPAMLSRAVERNAATKGQAVRGDARMEDLSDAGKRFIPPGVPNSGTADRKGLMELGMALVGGHAVGIPHSAMAAGIGAAGLYSQPGQALARALMAGGPQTRAMLAEAMQHVPATRAAVALQNRE